MIAPDCTEGKDLLRVAAYCRVSTATEEQATSIELQEQYYAQLIATNPNWVNAGAFCEQISGLNIEKRPKFQAMMQLCRKRKIDLILTKSISRLGRNTLDVLQALWELQELDIDEMIPRIADVLNQNKTPEDIIVYRFTHLKVMRNLCGTWLLRSGLTFSDKAFLSTTLLWKQLVPFGKDHHCNCMLKLYLPKGTHGAYVSLNDERDHLREYEFLLPPNLRFKIVKCCFLSYPARIKCVALVG